MNKYLSYSSIITGLIILLIICNKYNPKYKILYLFVLLGIITSVLNHGTNSKEYKYIDRAVIVLNVLVFIYFILQNQYDLNKYKILIIIVAGCLYLYSKLLNSLILRNSLHSFAHFLCVILLNIMHKT